MKTYLYRSLTLIGLASFLFLTGASAYASQAVDLLLNKAKTLEGRGLPALAIQSWQQVLLADPNNQEALSGLARASKVLGKKVDADRYLEQLRKIAPNSQEISAIVDMPSAAPNFAQLSEAQRLTAKRDYEGAMRIYRQVFANEPPAGNWAIAYYETLAATPGGWSEAVSGLKQLMIKYPSAPAYELALGKLYSYHPTTRAEGLQLLQHLKGDAGTMNSARIAWRQALIWNGRTAESLPSLRAYLALYPDPELDKLLAAQPAPTERSVASAANPGLPSPAAVSTAAVASREVTALSVPAYAKMKAGDFPEAIRLLQEALAKRPKDAKLKSALETARFWNFIKQGNEYSDNGRYTESVAEYNQALQLRPHSADALGALGKVLMEKRDPARAMQTYQELVRVQPASPNTWYELLRSSMEAGKPAEGVALLPQVPSAIRAQWNLNPSVLAFLASLYAGAGETARAVDTVAQADKLLPAGTAKEASAARLQVAGAYLRINQSKRAAALFKLVADSEPSNIDAWNGYLSALIQSSDVSEASLVLQQMPPAVYQAALDRRDFLRTVAELNFATKRYDQAELLLRKLVALNGKENRPTEPAIVLRLAVAYVHQGKAHDAESVLADLTGLAPTDAKEWLQVLSLLHDEHQNSTVADLLSRAPAPVLLALRDNPELANLQIGIYTDQKQYALALDLVEKQIDQARMAGRPVDSSLMMQKAWAELNARVSDPILAATLNTLERDRRLSASQKQDLDSIWGIWSQRRAQAAAARGDLTSAIEILQAATRAMAQNSQLKGQLAGLYLQASDPHSAYAVYRGWGLLGAAAADYAGAVGSALAVKDKESAHKWLVRGMQRFPRDASLLSLAAKVAANEGDYKRAELYLREALASRSISSSKAPAVTGEATPGAEPVAAWQSPKGALAAAVLRADGLPAASDARNPEAEIPNPESRDAFPSVPSENPTPRSAEGDSEQRDGSASMSDRTAIDNVRNGSTLNDSTQTTVALPGQPLLQTGETDALMGGSPSLPSFNRQAKADFVLEPSKSKNKLNSDTPDLDEQIRNNLSALEARNGPDINNSVIFQGRSGQAGIDRLSTQEINLEASTSLADNARLTLVAKPTYLDSGRADGNSTLPYGTSREPATSTQPTAFGIGADLQLASRNFGAHVGMSPSGFLVRNWLGGVRIRPLGGPFTILLDRQTVRDTKLSFAGDRDPGGSGAVWGGVVANVAALQGNWGDEKSGLYASVGYQLLTGRNVERNTRIDANVGGYIKLYSNAQGSLTAGLNVFGMHYDKNLRYFTIGQGGYFSPQEYFLASIPLRWTGKWNNVLQYTIGAGIGAQHFQEDPSWHSLSQTSLASSTGGNYNLDFRLAYQIAPQWIAGVFAEAGNSRDYRNAAGGIYLRYLIQPRPVLADINLQSRSDWRGTPIFGLP